MSRNFLATNKYLNNAKNRINSQNLPTQPIVATNLTSHTQFFEFLLLGRAHAIFRCYNFNHFKPIICKLFIKLIVPDFT
jgi:hypothetical protein